MRKIALFMSLALLPLMAGGTYVDVESKLSVESCTQKIKAAIKKKKGFSVFTVIDHQKNAQGVGLTMPKTNLIIFGNPMGGTKLMDSNRMMAYELPLKLLVAEVNGTTVVSYRNPKWLANNYGLYKSPIIPKMTQAMAAFSAVCR